MRGAQRSLFEISQTTGPLFKFKTPFEITVRELSEQGKKIDLDNADDVTDRVKVKMF